MSIKVDDTSMASDRSPHRADLWPMPGADESPTMWRVSWLPERPLERSQATSAMVIADVVGSRTDLDLVTSRHIGSLAAELGLDGPDAVARASELPEIEAGE